MKKRKNIILSVLVIFIIAMICGTILYFNNRNLNYKPRELVYTSSVPLLEGLQQQENTQGFDYTRKTDDED